MKVNFYTSKVIEELPDGMREKDNLYHAYIGQGCGVCVRYVDGQYQCVSWDGGETIEFSSPNYIDTHNYFVTNFVDVWDTDK